ncbi:hypothetical protein [Thiolapillus sp.]|uniref:hypothetical protein n=1 Tax=Thiolapillus sp. TaxID=2017437 RepID=UPI003AF4B288
MTTEDSYQLYLTPPVIRHVIADKGVVLRPPCDRERLREILDIMDDTGAGPCDLAPEDMSVLSACAQQYLDYIRALRTPTLN